MKNIKFKRFLENAKLLNEQYNIIPLLYGSVGLEEVASYYMNADDIDILIPEEFVTGERWNEFLEFLTEQGYVLVDEHEHTFLKDENKFAFAGVEELKEFADIDPRDISIYEKKGIMYKLLSLNQYLKVYEASLNSKYRAEVAKKTDKDQEKIDIIKSKL